VASGSDVTCVWSGLEESTTYFWRVVAKDIYGAYMAGPVWQFATYEPNNPPYEPIDPDPRNDAEDVVSPAPL